jgi:hypothetical protein
MMTSLIIIVHQVGLAKTAVALETRVLHHIIFGAEKEELARML